LLSIHTEHTEFVKNVHLFNDLTKDQLDDVLQHAYIQKLDKDQILFSQGDQVDRFYLVYSGQIKLFRLSAEGQEKIIEIVISGQTFAEALMFLERPRYPVSCSALKDAEIIVFDSKQFLKMLRLSPDMCFILLGTMSQRIRGLIHEIDNLSLQNGRHRLSAYLLEQAGDADYIKLSVPKSVLSSRLSIQPETFSRIVKQLRNTSTIKVDGSEIEILDREQLEEYATI